MNEEVEFQVTMTSGSNIQMEWMIDHNYTTCLDDYRGRVRSISKNFTFPVRAQYNMTAFARNALKPVYKIMSIIALRRVTNFNVTTIEGLYNTREEFAMNVSNSLTAAQLSEMGDVFLDVIYGNGLNDTFQLNADFDNISGSWASYLAKYMIQGNYTLVARVRNYINYQEFEFSFYAWDTLNVSLSSGPYVTIGDPFTFTFENPPLAAFQYMIDYGNGKVFDTNESIWYEDFSLNSWKDLNYTNPGTFELRIVMWNPFYVVVQNYSLIAEHPITDMTLFPTSGDFPSPDETAYFSLTMVANKPSPTDVTCYFSFQDRDGFTEYGDVSYPNVLFTYQSPYEIQYTYRTLGYRNVTFNCSNLVSSMYKVAEINIRKYDINDFEVIYPEKVAMNMSSTGNGTDIENDPLGIYAIPVDVEVRAKLYNMVIVPNNLKFTWNFDDGTFYEYPAASVFTQRHIFRSRRLHNARLTITDTFNQKKEVAFPIQMGVVNFTANIYDGSPTKDTFVFTARGMKGSATYSFDLRNSPTPQVRSATGEAPVSVSTVYNNRGQYLPVLTATNGTLTEEIHPPRHIGVDFVFSGINWTMDSVVPLPTGEVMVTFAIPNDGDPVLDITCSFLSGDRIDKAPHYQTTNMSDINPIVFNYTYLTLGYHNFTATCANFNFRDKWTNSSVILVHNKCYSINGVFDRQYSNKTSPMIVLTSKDVDLASRMLVYCPEKNPNYEWRYFNVSLKENTEVEFVYTPAFVPKGSVRFSKGTMPEGLYQVSLNVSLEDTWIQEYTFIEFKKPPPYAYIVKGSKRMAAISMKVITIDGFTESYDAQLGYGYNTELQFTWYCNK